MAYVMIPGFLCERCGHRWIRKQPGTPEPKVCPKCKSTYWNTQRQRPLRHDSNPSRNDWTINRQVA